MTQPRNMFPEGSQMRRVIDFSTQEFFAKGVRQVTMDDIAKGLQMSKRTLYQLFADKEQLVIASIEVIAEQEHQLALSLIDRGYNVMEIILHIMEHRLKGLKTISPQFAKDLTRYESVMEYVGMMHQESLERTVGFLQHGVEQGYFRDDVNFKLIMHSMLSEMNTVTTSELFVDYSLEECFVNLGIYHLRGTCTPKGVELIDAFLERYRQLKQQEAEK